MIARRVPYARRLSALTRAAAICLQLAWTGVAHGQEDANAQETAAARALAVEGVKLAQAGQCKDALDKLERSEKLRHSSIVLGHLGECQISLGEWVEGSENLRKLLRDPMPADASTALSQAYERAAATLRDIKPRIPTVTVTVKAPRDVDVTLRVDGIEVPDGMIGVPMPADPGDHALEAEAPGFLKTTATVHLEASGKETVSLDLKRDPFAAEAKPTLTPTPATAATPPAFAATNVSLAATPEPARGSSKVLAYVSYGVGAVGLGVGLGFGRAAMQAEDDLSTRCPNKVCSPDAQGDLDSAKTKGLVSTIGFGVGAAGIALGTVLLITSSSSASSQTGVMQPLKLRPRAAIGLGSVAVGADF